MNRISLMAFALVVLLALPAFALDLQSARSSGLVGEKLDGYVAAMQETAEAKALVAEVNARRQQEYARISAQNTQPVDVVARLAAEQIINKLGPGSYYQAPGGGWQKR